MDQLPRNLLSIQDDVKNNVDVACWMKQLCRLTKTHWRLQFGRPACCVLSNEYQLVVSSSCHSQVSPPERRRQVLTQLSEHTVVCKCDSTNTFRLRRNPVKYWRIFAQVQPGSTNPPLANPKPPSIIGKNTSCAWWNRRDENGPVLRAEWQMRKKWPGCFSQCPPAGSGGWIPATDASE